MGDRASLATSDHLGVALGPGFLTYQRYPVYRAALLWAVMSGDPLYAAALAVSFACVRALPVLFTLAAGPSQRVASLPAMLVADDVPGHA